MQKKKLFLSLMVASSFMFILVGCGGDDNGASPTNASFECGWVCYDSYLIAGLETLRSKTIC